MGFVEPLKSYERAHFSPLANLSDVVKLTLVERNLAAASLKGEFYRYLILREFSKFAKFGTNEIAKVLIYNKNKIDMFPYNTYSKYSTMFIPGIDLNISRTASFEKFFRLFIE